VRRARRGARGFTLIEVLVALAIVTVGMAAVLGTLSSSADTVVYLRDKTFANWVALNQIAQVHAPEAQLITVQPFDPTSLGAIEKAIRIGDLGLNPMNDGKIIRVPIPALTEERRKDMVKHLHKVLEEHRTAVRNIRRDGNDAIKKAMKDKKITEDDEKRAMEEIQKLTDDEIKKMEDMSKAKEKEVMEI